MYCLIYYYHLLFLDRDDCYDCEHILEKLESIDEDTEALNIPLVKVNHIYICNKYRWSMWPNNLSNLKRNF